MLSITFDFSNFMVGSIMWFNYSGQTLVLQDPCSLLSLV